MPAPTNTRFLTIVGQPSQGTCPLLRDKGRQLHCDLGTLDPGHTVGVRVLVGVRGTPGDQVHNTATAACAVSALVPCTAVDGATTRLIKGRTSPCAAITATPRGAVLRRRDP